MGFDCTFHKQNGTASNWKDYNKLRNAIRNRDLLSIEYLIERGVQINRHGRFDYEQTPLHLAVISRCPEIVKTLLDHGANINDRDAFWETPLMLAAKINDTVVLDLLLSYDVDMVSGEHGGRGDNLNHLHIACMRNRLNIVKKLSAKGNGDSINEAVKGNSLFWSGFTPLHFAVYYGCIETVEYLLRCGANMMATDSKQLTSLHWAHLQRNERIIDLLLTAHEHELTNPVGSHGLTHFHIACTRDNPSIVHHFLKLGVNIDLEVQAPTHVDWNHWKPIHFAMYYECPNVVDILLKSKADPTVNKSMWNPDLMQYAFKTGNYGIYDLFTKDIIELRSNVKGTEKLSDFHMACVYKNVDDIKLMLSQGSGSALSDLNTFIWNGYSPLHLAVKYNAIDAIALLLAHGADIEAQDSMGRTPLHIAFENKHVEVMNRIIENFADGIENVVDYAGLSFLHILCSTDRVDKIENFLAKGVDISVEVGNASPCWGGFTPMHFACKFKQKNVVELLHLYGADIFIKNGSIIDHFDLIFQDLHEDGYYLPEFGKVMLENLMMILSCPSTRMKYSNDCAVSPLHVLCLDPDTDLDLLKQYLITHQNEMNQTIKAPQSRHYHKCTPLHLAILFEDYKRAKLLIEAGADPLLTNGAGDTPIECIYLFEAMINISDHEAEVIFPVGVPVETLKPSHFFIACCAHAFEFVKSVLNRVNDPELKKSFLDCRNDLNQTPLHALRRQYFPDEEDSLKQRQMMRLLLEHGADVNAANYRLETPLHYANEEIVYLLLEYGANVNFQNLLGQTPLYVMCESHESFEHDHRMILLLAHGADINIQDKQGRTCLMLLDEVNELNSSTKKFAIPLLEQVKKLQTIGIHMDKRNEVAYMNLLSHCEDVFDPIKFENECQKEIELMKLEKIDRYTTLHDILFKSSNEMAIYCDNRVFLNLFRSNIRILPIYSSVILLQIKRGRSRQPLLGEATKSLEFLFGRSLPRICVGMILDHLSDVEVKRVILSRDTVETVIIP